MPIYLYQCDSCGVSFEKMQRMAEEPLSECPECEGQVHRVIQPVGIIFKGSGFYVTDNRQGSSSTLAPSKEKDKEADKPATDKPATETTTPSTSDKETKAKASE